MVSPAGTGSDAGAREVAHATSGDAIGAMAMTGMRTFTMDLGIVLRPPPEGRRSQR